MKTPEEIELLKAQWEYDPCWDIYATEGFEEHENELRDYQSKIEKKWADYENARVDEKCKKLGCTPATLIYIEMLESKIDSLESLVIK